MKKFISYRTAGKKAYAFWGVLGAILTIAANIFLGPQAGSLVDAVVTGQPVQVLPNAYQATPVAP